ncbi:hypothetical protein [Pseudomonas sp. p99-361]|uniref:hypothetical protein n=1 Tax=Pseudomonas sp. p99-361 TaxID=2479852 RepID=UPI000F76DC88|nr:hypothetical protein [Pseudomonas sp. p99-361]RRV60342.1 hypothetical protein EGJ15_20175 [Pseudomonas sp. p99-361]
MDTNKMREQFETAYTAYCEKMGIISYTAFHRAREVYISSATELAWQMWQASRAAVVVELPKFEDYPASIERDMRESFRAAIEAQGLKVEVKP